MSEKQDRLYAETLARAVALVGNTHLLAHRLHVRHAALLQWMDEVEPVPPAIFLRVVDLVLGLTMREESGDGSATPQLPTSG
jgi:hypothetical protein